MGFLDYFGDAAKGAADSILADMERKAQEKHDMAMADKAIAREQAMTFMRGRQERKLNEQNVAAAEREADAKRKAERESEKGKQKWEREKLTTEEAGRDRRANISANRPRGETQGPTPKLFKLPDGTPVWVKPGDVPPSGARPWPYGRQDREDSQPTDPNAWLSQF